MAGQPTLYKEDIIERSIAYIDSCVDVWEQVVVQDGKDSTTYKERLRVKIPSVEGLAIYLGIHRDTVYTWEKAHPAFSDTLELLRLKQAERLLNNGLSGDYNSGITKVLLGKHGYAEKKEIDHTTLGEKIQFGGVEILSPTISAQDVANINAKIPPRTEP